MTRLTAVLLRVPMIKFRKGKAPSAASAAAPAPAAAARAQGSCPAARPQQAAPMSTSSSIPDIDLPIRYRRHPPSQEEIDHINGGGIA